MGLVLTWSASDAIFYLTKRFETSVRLASDAGAEWGGAGRLDRVDRVLRLPSLGWRLGAGLVAVAVNRAVLIRELAWVVF